MPAPKKKSRPLCDEMTRGTVKIQLSQGQIDAIRSSVGAESMSFLLGDLSDDPEALGRARQAIEEADTANLSSSLLLGLLVLGQFPRDGSPIANAEIARRLGLSPSTSLRYATTLLVLGLIEKGPDGRKYRLTKR